MQHPACERQGFKHSGHVAQRHMIRDESQRCAEDLRILLSMELMGEKDKASELCHVLHTGSLLVAAPRTDRRTE